MFADTATEDFFRARLDHMIDLHINQVDLRIILCRLRETLSFFRRRFQKIQNSKVPHALHRSPEFIVVVLSRQPVGNYPCASLT